MLFAPYIMFKGNAEEALEFYGKVLGVKAPPYIMRYSEGEGMDIPEDYGNKIMHAELAFSGGTLYLSDCFPGQAVTYTDGISFNLGPEDEAQLQQLFSDLSEGGTVVQPIADMFWGSKFGSVNDKYGIHWSLNYALPQEE